MEKKTSLYRQQAVSAMGAREDGIPYCPGPDSDPHPPTFAIPPGAVDTHAHIFGPESRYPYSPKRGYTPPDAPLDTFLKLHETLGIARGVLTQPSVYGTDNSAILDAVAKVGMDRFRAVVAVAGDVTDAELEAFHAAGARGVRVNLVDKGGMPFDTIEDVAEFTKRLKDLGWHLEVLIHVSDFPYLRGTLESMAVDVVVGHLGYMNTGEGLGNAGFQTFLDLLR
ncbi:MAG: amidohydrolase family protein, partial [Rhodospirillales bacterium]|nr:amidohydrolase family protein [Rhodospirillales bacterium]